MKVKEFAKKILTSKKHAIIFFTVSAILLVALFCLVTYNRTPQADTTSMNKLLREASDLTTAELRLTNITKFEDEGIKFLNRSDFIMVYEATVWAGIDVEKVEIIPNHSTKVIEVNIPKATIQNVKVDSSTIEYFDEGFSLFNPNEKEDNNAAIVKAEEDIKEDALKSGILELADKQSATLIEGLLAKAVPAGYTLEAKVVE